MLKLNVDDAVNTQDDVAGSWGVERDAVVVSEVHAWCKAYPLIVDPLTSEAIALCDAVVFAQVHNFKRVIIETDCSELVHFLGS